MPLSFAPLHKNLKITKVNCDSSVSRRLFALGIVEGADITLMDIVSGAGVILIKDSRLALDRALTRGIQVEIA